MIKKTLTTAALVIAFIAICYAATTDITGNWTGNINGQFDVAYTFKQDGEKLTGSMKGPDGNDIPMKDGVVKADSLSFTFDMMGTPAKATGKIKADTLITMTMHGTPMGDLVFDIKKAK